MQRFWSRLTRGREPRRLWLDLGPLGNLFRVGPEEQWQDHGEGLLRTILHQNGLMTDMASTRACNSWEEVGAKLTGYDILLMNVRSYTFPIAMAAARIFKQANPGGMVVAGGLHATVAVDEMAAVPEFDRICQGPGEKIIVDLVRNPKTYPRIVQGVPSASMAEWPAIDRTLWPQPVGPEATASSAWPLEPSCGWGPPPVATVLTSRVCPWHCVFCNESSYLPSMGRRPVESVIDELNYLDEKFGPLGSVVIHDSMFFQNPSWLEEWLEKYPRMARSRWPYWAAGRADTIRRWPELFEALVRETNWRTVSVGFESGSDRMLRMLDKECTAEDNRFAIDLLNRIGDDLEARGEEPPVFWANLILAIPGETRDDAFKTMRMLRRMRRVKPSFAFYAPYPGSALGHQLIAEGKSLMSRDNYHRYPHDEKVKGVEYQFFRDLLAGKYDNEIAAAEEKRAESYGDSGKAHHMYLFNMTTGKKKLAYGQTPEDALEVLGFRLADSEMAQIVGSESVRISQRRLQEYVHLLG